MAILRLQEQLSLQVFLHRTSLSVSLLSVLSFPLPVLCLRGFFFLSSPYPPCPKALLRAASCLASPLFSPFCVFLAVCFLARRQ